MMHQDFRSIEARRARTQKYRLRQTSHSSLLVAREGDVSRKFNQWFLLFDSFNFNFFDDERTYIYILRQKKSINTDSNNAFCKNRKMGVNGVNMASIDAGIGELHTGPKHQMNGADPESYTDIHVIPPSNQLRGGATACTWRCITRLTPGRWDCIALDGCSPRSGQPR